jgi:hypothetical protein
MKLFATGNSGRNSEQGSMLLELLISMVGGLLVLMVSAMSTNTRSSNDTTSTMVAEHVLEQISAQAANDNNNLTITDCAGTVWTIATTGATKGSGSGINGGNGAALTTAGIVDWTQSYGSVPNGYAIRYVACGSGGRQITYDIRWNVMKMSTYSRMVVLSARPSFSPTVGGLRYVVPVNLRTIGGM